VSVYLIGEGEDLILLHVLYQKVEGFFSFLYPAVFLPLTW